MSAVRSDSLVLPQVPEWHIDAPELAEADAKAQALHDQLAALQERKAGAEAELAAGLEKRASLLSLAKAGQPVTASDVADNEAATRIAEANAALLSEAMTGLGAELDRAEAAIRKLVMQERDRFGASCNAYRKDMAALLARVEGLMAQATEMAEPFFPNVYYGAESIAAHKEECVALLAPASFGRVTTRAAKLEAEAKARQAAEDEARSIREYRERQERARRDAEDAAAQRIREVKLMNDRIFGKAW